MPLRYTGISARFSAGVSYQAKNARNETIAVKVSDEALKDYKEAACKRKGSAKYDAGQVTGSIVTVQTSDFK